MQDIESSVEQTSDHIRPGCVAAFVIESGAQGGNEDQGELSVVVAEVRQKLSSPTEWKELANNVVAAVQRDHGLVLHRVVFISARTILKTSSGKIQASPCGGRGFNSSLYGAVRGKEIVRRTSSTRCRFFSHTSWTCRLLPNRRSSTLTTTSL